jgi:hypothetical protein
MQINLIILILALICIPSLGYLLVLLLMMPAWLRGQENPDPNHPMRLEIGCLYLLTAPLRLLLLYLWQLIVQPLVRLALILAGGLAAFILQFNLLARISQWLFFGWVRFSERLWNDNLNAESIFRNSNARAVYKARGFLEQILMQHASVQLLKRSLLFSAYDFLGISHAVPTVLAAIACDESRSLDDRIAAVNVLGNQGYRSLLLSIAKNGQRSGAVVRQAAESLELRSDWRGAHQAWRVLMEHKDAEVRLLAANHIKLDPGLRNLAGICLRSILRDERIRLASRIEAAAALGRINLLAEEEYEFLYEWMNTAPDHAERLHAAFALANLRRNPNALGKLRRYTYEIEPNVRQRGQSLEQKQKADEVERLRSLAIEYLGRLDQTEILRPLGRMDWLNPAHRLRIAEILSERGYTLEAARNRLSLSQDIRAPASDRHNALHLAVNGLGSRSFGMEIADSLVDVLSRLGSDSEPCYSIRLEAARQLAALGLSDPARNILLVLAHGSNPEPTVRRQATRELRRLSSLTF